MTTYILTAHKDGEEDYTYPFHIEANWEKGIDWFVSHGWAVHIREETEDEKYGLLMEAEKRQAKAEEQQDGKRQVLHAAGGEEQVTESSTAEAPDGI